MLEQALDPQRQEKAREYARATRQLILVDLVLGAVFLLTIWLSGISSGLSNLLSFPYTVKVALYFLVLMMSYGILSAPLGYYRDFVLPHRYGLSYQSWQSWMVDKAKESILGLTLSLGLVVVIYLFLLHFPQTWWLLAFAFITVVTIIMTKLAPVLIVPLFLTLEPIKDDEIRQRLLNLAQRCQIKVNDVYQINLGSKTSTANAMLMGWGNTKRIALSDTLLTHYTPAEIEVIMAHELGHQRHRDIAKALIVRSVLLFLGFYLINIVLSWAAPIFGFASISDVAAFPLLAFVLIIFFLMLAPLTNAYSRYLEEAADTYAIAVTDNPGAFATMLTKLTNQNLTDSEPGTWIEFLFHDHPSYYKRLELAHRYQRGE